MPRRNWVVLVAMLMMFSMVLAACGPTPEPVTEVLTQVVEVEKEVTRVVEGTPVVETIIVTQVVEKEVTTVVEMEKVVTATPEPEAPAGAVKRGGVLEWARRALPATFDPIWTDSNWDIWLFQNIYEPLVRATAEGSGLEASLAESWEVSEDGLVYTFNLRPGVQFHDGSPVKASDVVWSLDRARDPEAELWNWTLENVTAIEAVDDATVAITLDAPAGNFLTMLTMFNASILPQALVEEQGVDEFFKIPTGTGPFQVTEYVVGDYVVFEKNPNYWELGADGESLPYLDGVRVVQVPEDSTRVLQVQSGRVDGTDYVPFSMVEQLESDPTVSMELFSSTQGQYAWMNHRKPPLDDVNVRLALSYAVDRQAMIDTVVFGIGQEATALRPVGTMCWNGDLEGFPYDLEKAKQLMADSNYPDGYDGLLITISAGSSEQRDVATVLKEMWAPLGIEVVIQEMELGVWYDEYEEEEFVIQIGTWTDDVIDPSQQIQYMAVDPAGRTGWENERVQELSKAAVLESDPDVRCEMFGEIQEIFNEEAVEIILYSTPFTVLLNKDVNGYKQGVLGWLIWKEAWLDR
jgi:peptide/nickel transport system substrate-binding protein